jgi:hypothetical protein
MTMIDLDDLAGLEAAARRAARRRGWTMIKSRRRDGFGYRVTADGRRVPARYLVYDAGNLVRDCATEDGLPHMLARLEAAGAA